MKISNNILYILGLVLTIYSCNVTDDNTDVLVDIDTEFEAELGEILSLEKQELTLNLKTQDRIACELAYLNHRIRNATDHIEIELLGISKPFGCDASILEPVQSYIKLGKKEVGSYPIKLKLLNSFENNGAIVIRDDSYQIILENDKGFQIQFKTLMKTDPDLFWGYLSTTANFNLNILGEDFKNTLGNQADYSVIQTGTYNDFFIGDDGVINLRSIPDGLTFLPIYFKSINNRQELINTIESYQAQLPAEIQLHLFAGTGEQF